METVMKHTIAHHTRRERDVLRMTTDLMRTFLELELEEGEAHPSHASDVAGAIHDIQRIVAMRLAKRVDPLVWEGR